MAVDMKQKWWWIVIIIVIIIIVIIVNPWWNCKKCKCVRDSLCKYPQENCYAPCQSGQQCYKFACGS